MDLDTQHFTKVLYEIANLEPKVHVREILKAYANNVDFQIKLFTKNPSTENLRNLIGIWTRATKALDMVTPKVPPNDGVGGRLFPPKLQQAA